MNRHLVLLSRSVHNMGKLLAPGDATRRLLLGHANDYYVCSNSMHVPAVKLICIEYD